MLLEAFLTPLVLFYIHEHLCHTTYEWLVEPKPININKMAHFFFNAFDDGCWYMKRKGTISNSRQNILWEESRQNRNHLQYQITI